MPNEQGEIPFPYQLQPTRTITERNDGVLEGSVEFVTYLRWEDHLPKEGDEHPDNNDLELHTREKTYTTHGLVTLRAHYIGLREDPTDPILSYIGNPDREDIRTHPDFVSKIAGKPGAELNGAKFVDVYRREPVATTDIDYQFSHFDPPAAVPGQKVISLAGVQYYLKPSTTVEATWWQTKVPELKRMEIVKDIKPFKKPDDVGDFLIIDTPYRQIGRLYQVTQIALGSDSQGWNQLLYPQKGKKRKRGL